MKCPFCNQEMKLNNITSCWKYECDSNKTNHQIFMHWYKSEEDYNFYFYIDGKIYQFYHFKNDDVMLYEIDKVEQLLSEQMQNFSMQECIEYFRNLMMLS